MPHYPITVTLAQLRAAQPCAEGWTTLLRHLRKHAPDEEPLLLETILDSNGLRDALWCCRVLPAVYTPALRLLACAAAQRVLPLYEQRYPGDERPRRAIETAQRYAKGQCPLNELSAAYAAAYTAAAAAAAAVAYAAAAAAAADVAAYTAAAAAQSQLFRQFCRGDFAPHTKEERK